MNVHSIPRVLAGLLLAWVGLSGYGCSWHTQKSVVPDLQQNLDQARKVKDPLERNRLLIAALHARVLDFQSLVESNLVLRENILREANRLEAAFANQPELAPADLKLVSEGAAKYLRLRDQFFKAMDRYQPLFDYPESEMRQLGVDPRLRLVATMVSVGAALTLYDNYLTTVIRFETSPALRHYINDGDSATGMNRRALEQIGQSARSLINRGQVRMAIRSIEHWKTNYAAWRREFASVTGDPDVLHRDYLYLDTLIESSIAYRHISALQPGELTFTKLNNTVGRTVPDLMQEGGESLLRMLSQLFVGVIAVVEPRPGLLHGDPARLREAVATIGSRLKPGDILLEKSGFRLTDLVVPGHFGHSGIWLGTDAELAALGVWDDPRLKQLPGMGLERLRTMIREGRCVVEALRPGVVLNTLEHFLNVDDLLLVRPRMNEDPARVADTREAIITAMTHLGKSYDFGFDVHSRRRIVCSELSFQSYTQPEFHWPKERVMGRYTISPDHVARRALPVAEYPPAMRVLLFYSRGERVPGDQAHLEKEIAARINVKLKEQ